MHRLDVNNRMQLNDGRNFAFYFAEMHLVGSTIVASFSLFFACSLIFYTIFGLGKRCRLSPLRAGILFHVISSSINEKKPKAVGNTCLFIIFRTEFKCITSQSHSHPAKQLFFFFFFFSSPLGFLFSYIDTRKNKSAQTLNADRKHLSMINWQSFMWIWAYRYSWKVLNNLINVISMCALDAAMLECVIKFSFWTHSCKSSVRRTFDMQLHWHLMSC